MQGMSWGVLPLVAGLFVLVEALDSTGVIAALATLLRERGAERSRASTASGRRRRASRSPAT